MEKKLFRLLLIALLILGLGVTAFAENLDSPYILDEMD